MNLTPTIIDWAPKKEDALTPTTIARESGFIILKMQPWRRLFPEVTVRMDGAAIRLSCEGREVRIVLPVGALEWSLDEFSSRVLFDPMMHLTNYDLSLGG